MEAVDKTILFLNQGLVNDVMIVCVLHQFELIQLHLDSVYYRYETEVIAWWARSPILSKISEHVDMIAQKGER